MEDMTWERVEGMILTAKLDPQDMIAYLTEKGVVAQLDWFAETPELMGISIGVLEDRVARIPSPGAPLEEGPTIVEFIGELADRFQAEVRVGEFGVYRLPEDFTQSVPAVPDQSEPLKVVEICEAPASAIPLMAALAGVDVASVEMEGDKRALIAELPAGRTNWTLSEPPMVTLTASGEDFQAFLIKDDDPENIITYNWGMEEVVVPGAGAGDANSEQLAQSLVGARQDVEAIHDAVPGVSSQLAFASSQNRGALAVNSFVASLGLPVSVAEFLRGDRELDAIPEAAYHHARGVSNAIGRSVDLMIGQGEETSLWEKYKRTVADKPWLVPSLAGAEALLGAGLVVLSRGKKVRGGAGSKALAVVGGVLVGDAAINGLVAKYASLLNQDE